MQRLHAIISASVGMTTFYPMGRCVNRADGRHTDEFPCIPIANSYYRWGLIFLAKPTYCETRHTRPSRRCHPAAYSLRMPDRPTSLPFPDTASLSALCAWYAGVGSREALERYCPKALVLSRPHRAAVRHEESLVPRLTRTFRRRLRASKRPFDPCVIVCVSALRVQRMDERFISGQ